MATWKESKAAHRLPATLPQRQACRDLFVLESIERAGWHPHLGFSGEITSRRRVSLEGKTVDLEPDYRITKKARLLLPQCLLTAFKATNYASYMCS